MNVVMTGAGRFVEIQGTGEEAERASTLLAQGYGATQREIGQSSGI